MSRRWTDVWMTYARLIDNVDDDGALAGVRTVGDDDDATNFSEAREYLNQGREGRGGG